MAAGDFSRFFFEVLTDDVDGQDEYLISPETYVRFERGCEGYVAYTYDGSVLFAEEYDIGYCRPSVMSNYSSVMEREEMSLDEARSALSEWEKGRRRISEEDVPLCEAEGLYYCGNGSLPADTAPPASGRSKERWERIPRGLREQLRQRVGDAIVRVPGGTVGTIAEVGSAGMLVLFPDSELPRRFPLCRAFREGDLAFTDPQLQASADAALNRGERGSQASVSPGGSALGEADVAANVRLACWLAGVGEVELLEHMSGVGLPCFGESLEAGLGASPFATVREVARHVGCPLEVLLGTDDEVFPWLIGIVADSGEWELGAGASHSYAGMPAPYRYLLATDGEGRALLLEADYAGAGLSRCAALRFSTVTTVVDGVTVSGASIRRELSDPGPGVAKSFLDACAGAGGDIGEDEALARESATGERSVNPIRVNEFLVRRSYGSHATGGHRLDPVRATVSVLPRNGGKPVPVEFDAWWCPKCGMHFMGEGTYLWLKRQGFICCKVVEERDLGAESTGDGFYGSLASESVLHMYGYNVNQQDDLPEAERRAIISFVIENRIQTAQEVARLLEWLISQREGNPSMEVAVARWRADLEFVRHYHRPTRTVRVGSIFARVR